MVDKISKTGSENYSRFGHFVYLPTNEFGGLLDFFKHCLFHYVIILGINVSITSWIEKCFIRYAGLLLHLMQPFPYFGSEVGNEISFF